MKLYLHHTCPCCGSKIYVTNRGYHCSNCDFHIKGYICNRHISIEDAEAILNEENPILDGFATDDGKIFSSIPVIKGNTVILDNTVFKCNTSLGMGRIIVGRRFFICEHFFQCNIACPFNKSNKYRIRRSIDGKMLTVDDIRNLCMNGKVFIQTYSEFGDINYRLLTFTPSFGKSIIKS